MSARTFLIAGAFALSAALVPVFETAAAKDDPAAQQKAREELRKELKETKKYFVFHDLSYFVDAPKLKDSRWDWKDPPPFSNVSEKQGGQFYATWVPNAGGEWGIRVVVNKMPFSERKGNTTSNFSYEFKSWGKSVLISKVDEMALGFYEDWLKESSEPLKEHCDAPKKMKVGPSDWYATAVATDKEEKKRVRKDWYVWAAPYAGTQCLWVAEFTFQDKFKEVEEVIKRSKDVMKEITEIKDKRAMN